MTDYDLNTFESRVDFASKLLSFFFKVGMLIGGSCLLFYCYRIRYFPVGVTLGDGFLLIILATSFGFIYGLFAISLTALGLWFTPFLRQIQKLGLLVIKRFSKNKTKKLFLLVSPDFSAFVLGIFGIVFITVIYQIEPSAIWRLSATAMFLGVVFSAYQEVSSKICEVQKVDSAKVIPSSNYSRVSSFDRSKLKTARALLLIALFTIPLVFGGVFGILLDGAMSFSGIKKGPSFVFIRAPYSKLLPSQFQAQQSPQVADYTAFEGIDVIFSGMGKKSVIEYRHEKKIQRMEVPNEHILVIPR